MTGGQEQVDSYIGKKLSENNEISILDNFSISLSYIKLPSKIKTIKGDINDQNEVNEFMCK